MAYHKLLVTISLLVSFAIAQNYNEKSGSSYPSGPAMQMQGSYPAPSYGHAAPHYENYGPDNAQYYYMVQNYDPYTYKNAHLNFNRYPGGAAYQLKEDGKGSYVNVNVETSRGKGGYGGKGY